MSLQNLIESNYFSFFGRLAAYTLCAMSTGGYIYGFILYLVLDLVIMDLAL
jgi:hypothetical protein